MKFALFCMSTLKLQPVIFWKQRTKLKNSFFLVLLALYADFETELATCEFLEPKASLRICNAHTFYALSDSILT